MFKEHPNHLEANNLLKIFSGHFNCTEFNTEMHQDKKTTFQYIARTPDKWNIVISFTDEKPQKSYYPSIIFIKERDLSNKKNPQDRQKKKKELADFMQLHYRPDFDRMINVLKIFTDQGIKSGLFNSAIGRKYKTHMKSHININHYRGQVMICDNNFCTIKFNRLLQKASGYKRDHYKQSYMSVSLDFLVHSDSSVHPYFKIRLPYNDKKKTTCVIPLSGEAKVYFLNNDDGLRKKPVDQMKSHSMDSEKLESYFAVEFQNEIKMLIVKTLNISKSDIKDATAEDLKSYFELIEMIKI